MTNVLVNCPDLYTAPPKLAIPGARWDVRKMALTVAQEVTTNIFALGVLPAGHILLDAFLESTDMDNGGTAAALDVGVVNSYYNRIIEASPHNYGNATNEPNVCVTTNTTGTVADTTATAVIVSGQKFISANAVAQAGGRCKPDAGSALTQIVGVDYKNDRIIGVQFSTAPGTAAVGTLTLGLLIDEA